MPYVTANGVNHFYREAGQGPAAMFIHGFPLDHTLWLDQLAGLGHVRRCIAPDLRGHGGSEPTTDPALTMELFAVDVAAVLGELGEEQADVVGLSMGGYVALALWESRPDLVRSLALVDTRAGADSAEGKVRRDAMIERILGAGRGALAEEMAPALLTAGASELARARLRTMIEGSRYETLIADLLGIRDRPDRTHLLAGVTVPVVVVTGEEDRLIPPAQAEELAKAIPGARLVSLPGAGHLPPLEAPTALNQALIELWEGRTVGQER